MADQWRASVEPARPSSGWDIWYWRGDKMIRRGWGLTYKSATRRMIRCLKRYRKLEAEYRGAVDG